MVSKNKQDDRLPAGWKVQIRVKNARKYKYYINKKVNKKFYSKLSMLRYIKDTSIGNEGFGAMKPHTKKSSAEKQLLAVEANDSQEWLPNGWITELTTRKTGLRKGTKYKRYIDSATGRTFLSKPEVCRYLESLQSNPGSSQQREEGSSRHSSDKKYPDPPPPLDSCMESDVSQLSKTRAQKSHPSGKRKVVVETTTDDELPPGWIKEIRNKVVGEEVVRSDPLYIDPTSLVFRSKPDALRYIRTGEVSRHAYRRKNISGNGEDNGEEYTAVKTSPRSSDEREKEIKTITGKELFTDELSPKQCISSLLEAGSKRMTRSSSRVANLDHSIPVLQPTNSAQKTTPGKSLADKIDAAEATGGMTKRSLPKVEDDNGMKDDATPKESKRITRSSSRVANLDHSIPVLQPTNSAQKTTPGKSLAGKIDAAEATGGMTKRSLPKVEDDNGMKDDATPKESKRANLDHSIPVLQPKNSARETSLGKSSADKRVQTREKKTKDRKITPNMPFRSSKRLAGVVAEVVYHSIPIEHANRARNQKPSKVQTDSSLGSTPTTEAREKPQPQPLNVIARDGCLETASQDERIRPLNADAQTVLGTREGPSKLCFHPEIDLLEPYPPGFETSPIRTHQSVYPKDSFTGSEIEKSSGNSQLAKEHPNEVQEIGIEPPAVVEREMEHSESQFCFTSPMWSDPCLEFAFKTLTGAIPLDDSLAIQDYIQHQIRTSSEQRNNNPNVPNTGVLRNETKPVSSLPEDIGVPKSNGFGSQRTTR